MIIAISKSCTYARRSLILCESISQWPADPKIIDLVAFERALFTKTLRIIARESAAEIRLNKKNLASTWVRIIFKYYNYGQDPGLLL